MVNCAPSALAAAAACYRCVPTLQQVRTYLLCQWANALAPDPIILSVQPDFRSKMFMSACHWPAEAGVDITGTNLDLSPGADYRAWNGVSEQTLTVFGAAPNTTSHVWLCGVPLSLVPAATWTVRYYRGGVLIASSPNTFKTTET